MNRLLAVAILMLGALYIFFIPDNSFAVLFIFKLIPMLLIIYYAYLQIPYLNKKIHTLIFIGLVFSIVGDGSIMFTFAAGLAGFLIAHIFYIIGFIRASKFTIARASILIILVPFSIWIGYQIVPSLIAGNMEFLIIPVIIYITAIAIMGFTAALTGNLFALFGSILFIISDSVLAWNEFVEPVANSRLLIMGTYYTAQFFIASSLRSIGRDA